MTEKKKAIIHIGGHKTGSSAIQAFCVLNAERLQRLGLFYPLTLLRHQNVVGGQAHHGLVNLFMDDTTFWKSFNMRPKGMSDNDIITNLKSLPRDKHLLLSSENLVWLDAEAIRALTQLLDGYEVRAILYARRQDDALQALYQTVVATIGEASPFNDYANEGVRIIFAYDKIAERWLSVLGEDKVTVRVYEKSQLYLNDSVADYFHVLSTILQTPIDIADWDCPSGIVNRGFPAHIIGLLRFFNGKGGKRWTLPAIKILAEILYKDSRGSYEIISPSQRRELLDYFAISNGNLARKFLGRETGVLFDDCVIAQSDADWHQKYDRPGSHLRLLVRDAMVYLKHKVSVKFFNKTH